MAYYNTGMFGQRRVDGTIFSGPKLGGQQFYDSAEDGRLGYEQFNQAFVPNGGAFGTYMRGRYLQNRDAYGAAQGKEPTLRWTDYLTQNQDKFASDYANLTPNDRGAFGARGARTQRLRWL